MRAAVRVLRTPNDTASTTARTRVATIATDMTQHDDATPSPGPDQPGAWDDALCRLEDVLLAAPYDRALPDLDVLLEQARVTPAFVHQDERALKLISEAMLARPFADHEDVRQSRAHVEMMTLEVEVLTHRLRDPATPAEVAERATIRLRELAHQLARLRDDL